MEKEIETIEDSYKKKKVPDFKVGDTVNVYAEIEEAAKIRTQIFQGVVMKIRGKGVNKTFTVRKISYGVGVEKSFPVHSPSVEKIEVIRKGKVRRSKLYYLRKKKGKKAKVKEER